MGLFTKNRITFQKPFRIIILTLSWFENLIWPFVNSKLFQIRLFKREKRALWIVIHQKAWFWGLVNAKLFWNMIPLGTRPLPHSAQVLFVIGTAVAMPVNECSWNHGTQSGSGSSSETAFGMWFARLWPGPICYRWLEMPYHLSLLFFITVITWL